MITSLLTWSIHVVEVNLEDGNCVEACHICIKGSGDEGLSLGNVYFKNNWKQNTEEVLKETGIQLQRRKKAGPESRNCGAGVGAFMDG